LIPGISVIASGSGGSADLIIRGIRAGAVEFLRRPISPDDLSAAMAKVRRLRKVPPGPGGSGGRITAVYATKGGVGVTTLATNVAVCLAQHAPGSVILIDLDLCQGGVNTFLNLRPAYSVVDAFRQTDRMDETFLRSLLVQHPCGLSVLAAPAAMEASRFTPDQVREGLELVRSHFAHVVVDLPHDLDPGTLAVLEAADHIFFLVGMNVPAVRAAAAGLVALRHQGIDRKVKVIVMRANARDELSFKQVREALGLPIFWHTPSDYPTVVASINEGIPVVITSPRTEIARNLRQLSEALPRGSAGNGARGGRSPSVFRRVWSYTGERARTGGWPAMPDRPTFTGF
jgi:pilus assembly protein CpaE